MQFKHISVLPKKVLDFAPEKTQTILDCTLGSGGHSRNLLEKFPNAKLFGIDRDLKALQAAKDFLKPFKDVPINAAILKLTLIIVKRTKVTDSGVLIFLDWKNFNKGNDIRAINIDRKNGTTILSAVFRPANIIMRPLKVKMVLYIVLFLFIFIF